MYRTQDPHPQRRYTSKLPLIAVYRAGRSPEKYHRSDNTISSSRAFQNKSVPAPAANRAVPKPILIVHSGRIKTKLSRIVSNGITRYRAAKRIGGISRSSQTINNTSTTSTNDVITPTEAIPLQRQTTVS